MKTTYLVAASLLLATPALSQTTNSPLFSSSVDVLGNPISYPAAGIAELTGALVTMMPGDGTGWHLHTVPTFGYLISGRLKVEYANGEVHEFEAGDGIIEAENVVHIGHNTGDEPVVIVVFQAGAIGMDGTRPADPPPAAPPAALPSDR